MCDPVSDPAYFCVFMKSNAQALNISGKSRFSPLDLYSVAKSTDLEVNPLFNAVLVK